MKGILLAGGTGSRLYPSTLVTSKQLLPVYDKPMIYYPLSLLMLSGISEILIISTPRDTPNIQELLGDGCKLGLNLSYAVQAEPRGIPEAFLIGEEFIGAGDVMLVLGDNIFYGQFDFVRNAVQEQKNKIGGFASRIFAYSVEDPSRYGVVEIEKKSRKVLSIEEKPVKPKSNLVVPGLYIFDRTVAARCKSLKPSKRLELEIVDLIKSYLDDGSLSAELIGRGVAWLDAGTPESLIEAGNFIYSIEKRQGLKVACIEEIALRQGFVSEEDYIRVLATVPNSPYKTYLRRVLEELSP